MSPAVVAELRRLCKAVICARAGAALVVEGARWKWWGACQRCRRVRWLQHSHIEPVGRVPALRYDSDNGFALCWDCHFHWWHKHPREAQVFRVAVMGPARSMALELRARTARRPDPVLQLMALRIEWARVAPGIRRSA